LDLEVLEELRLRPSLFEPSKSTRDHHRQTEDERGREHALNDEGAPATLVTQARVEPFQDRLRALRPRRLHHQQAS